MTDTQYYDLKKPGYSDFADIDDINDNMDAIDAALHAHDTSLGNLGDGKLDTTGDAANAKIGSSTASSASYPIPAANDTFKVILGKIIKFFGDIKSAITGLSISGKTITWTKADGTTGTLTTQDTTYSAVTNAANGLMTASVYRNLYNITSASDSGYNANNANLVWKCNANGQPGWRADANNTYTAGAGLSLASGQFKHSNSVTAGTAGTSSATNAQNTVAVPYVTYDAQGHITAAGTHQHTINGMGASSASAAGKTGLVPVPTAGKHNSYLRGDATWQAPQNNLTTTDAGYCLDARQGKVLNDKIAVIGTIASAAMSAAKSVSNSWTNLVGVSLTAGKWLVTVHAQGAAGQTGKSFTIGFASDSSFRQSVYCADANMYSASMTDCVNLSAQKTIYLNAWAATSTTIGVATITAIRIQ